jgi:hypothetical protein
MADNTTLPGTGDVIRDKDRAGIKTQIVALDLAPGGAETLMNGTMPVSETDGASVTLGATTDAAVTTSANGTVSGKLRGIVSLLAAGLPASLGQKAMAASTGVVIASDQSAVPIVAQAGTSGGWTSSSLVAAGSNNATSVKGSAGQVGGWYIANLSTGWRYVKLYNKATAPAPATDNALLLLRIGIPPGGAANVEISRGVAFSTGIGFATVTGVGDTDNTSVTANDLVINIFYK